VNEVRGAFFEAACSIRPLIASDELRAHWEQPSALQSFSIKGLAGHLVRAVQAPVSYLALDIPPGTEPVPAVDYYAPVLASMGEAGNRAVIVRGEENAGGSAADLLEVYDRAITDLTRALDGEPSDRLIRVYMDVVLRYDDYLLSRICEVLIHADDLAVSLGIEPPPTPQMASDLAIDHLVAVARRVHGDRAVLIALSRRERDTVEALRVF
jgi:uncharacterized protein (TIGR03083 family)